ncbi:MAG: hypothetical protein ACXIUB_11175 [Wenzhouxiangella sp.]
MDSVPAPLIDIVLLILGLMVVIGLTAAMVWGFLRGPRWLKVLLALVLAALLLTAGGLAVFFWMLGQTNWSL